jgi:hypothetical protein
VLWQLDTGILRQHIGKRPQIALKGRWWYRKWSFHPPGPCLSFLAVGKRLGSVQAFTTNLNLDLVTNCAKTGHL